MSNRVRWSPEERTLIVGHMARLLNTGRKFSRSSLVLAAQEALPYERRRSVFTNAESKGMFHRANELAALRLKDPVAQLPKPEPIVDNTETDLSKLVEALVSKLADEVAARVLLKLKAEPELFGLAVKQSQGDYPPPYIPRPKHNPQPVTGATGTPKVGVLVLGLQPHQANLLKSEFPDLDITCYDSDEARIKPVLLRAHVIAMTRFLSHQVDDRYKKSPRYHRLSHGFSELKTFMNMIQRGEV
jgi:hypothetical protein